MSFPKYPQYKNSGVSWIGDVPLMWSIGRLKHLLRIRGGQDYKVVESTDPTDIPVIGSGGQFTYATTHLYDGESVLLGRKGTIDKPLYIRGKFWTVDTMFYTEVLPEANGRYAYYAATTIPFSLYSTNTALPSMSQFDLANHALPLPMYSEQSQIARFLDHETAKIDALIREQERLIALLQEKRQAVISHAVTKGLDPNVPMKDSGVEWLGEVPEHWEVVRLKRIARSLKAGPFGSAITKDMYTASGYRVYGQEQVIPGDFKKGDYFISEEYFQQLQQYAVEPGDILISCVGTFGKIAIVPPDIEPGIINPRLIRLRTVPGVAPDFLGAVLKSDVVFEQFSFFSRGGTMDVINIGTLSDIWLPVPPLGAQSFITNHIHNKALEFDTLISAAHQNIDLLGERRSALISAAVTGKIDVRDWQPPTDESTLDPEVVETRSEVTA